MVRAHLQHSWSRSCQGEAPEPSASPSYEGENIIMLQVNNQTHLSNTPSTSMWISLKLMKVATLLLNLPLTLQMCLQTLRGWLFVQKGPRAHTGVEFSPQSIFLQIMPFPQGKKTKPRTNKQKNPHPIYYQQQQKTQLLFILPFTLISSFSWTGLLLTLLPR